MVATALTWNSNIDIVLGGVDAGEQYQNILYQFHVLLLAAGWTVVFTSNGSVADGNDNIGGPSDIVWGTEASQAHSYAVYQSPGGYGQNGGTCYFMWNADVAAATTNPQQVDFYTLVDPESYSLAGSPLTTRPVPSTPINEDNRLNIPLKPGSTFVPHHLHTWRNSRGEFLFMVSIDGTTIVESIVWAISPDGAEGINDFTIFIDNVNTGNGVLDANRLASAALYMSHWIDGTVQDANPQFVSIITSMSTWSAGLSSFSTNPVSGPADYVVDNATNARYFGRVVDLRFTSENLPPGTLDDSDAVDPGGEPNRMMSVLSMLLPTDRTQAAGGITL